MADQGDEFPFVQGEIDTIESVVSCFAGPEDHLDPGELDEFFVIHEVRLSVCAGAEKMGHAGNGAIKSQSYDPYVGQGDDNI